MLLMWVYLQIFTKGRTFIPLFDYLNCIHWTRRIVGTVLVHQRAIG